VNYLVGLGGTTYLEIIGFDPEQDIEAMIKRGDSINFDLDKMAPGAKMVGWAAQTDDLESVANAPNAWTGKPFDMSRKDPSGNTLEWSLSTPGNGAGAADMRPFFIDWTKVLAQGLHPSTTSPKGSQSAWI
jgi:hypothetical protein